MAEVQIKITGKVSSRVTVKRPSENGSKPLTAVLHTTWTKPEWDAMATDDATATQTAKTLGVEVEDLRAGIAIMQEQVRYYGPAVYRAICGHEVYKREDGPKAQVIKDLLMAWKGHPALRTEWLRTEGPIPERCQGCPKLVKRPQEFATEGLKEFVTMDMWWCNAHKIVPGEVPPPVEDQMPEVVQGE